MSWMTAEEIVYSTSLFVPSHPSQAYLNFPWKISSPYSLLFSIWLITSLSSDLLTFCLWSYLKSNWPIYWPILGLMWLNSIQKLSIKTENKHKTQMNGENVFCVYIYVCVCTIFICTSLCINIESCMPQCVCRGQRTIRVLVLIFCLVRDRVYDFFFVH